jgi:hypothetical protein
MISYFSDVSTSPEEYDYRNDSLTCHCNTGLELCVFVGQKRFATTLSLLLLGLLFDPCCPLANRILGE